MSNPFRPLTRTTLLSILLCCFLSPLALPALAENLVVDGDFEGQKNGNDLRRDSKGSDWYESRKDTKEGSKLVILSKRKVGGNKTQKAMFKAHPELNTYLSHKLTRPLELAASASYDIYVKEILADDNRSCFFFMGGIKDKKGGPNSTGKERFVFLGFENAETPGKINLFAREGSEGWAAKTIIVRDLDLRTWYTIKIEAEIPEAYYSVQVEGLSDPYDLESFYYKGKTPEKITHISFASWNDGAGAFYIDNVEVSGD